MQEDGVILVPVDGSPLSEAAVSVAGDLAQARKTRVALLFISYFSDATDPEEAEESWLPIAGGNVRTLAESVFQAARKALPKNVPVREYQRTGTAADEIIRFAKEENVSMIVLTSALVGSWKGMLLGSVGQAILEEAPCNVVLVRQAKNA